MNLSEIDSEQGKRKFEAVDTADYTLQVDSLVRTKMTPRSGKQAGTEIEVVKGSFTMVDNPQYGHRKFWNTFWPNATNLKMLYCMGRACGLPKTEEEHVNDWIDQFAKLDPPARFTVTVEKKAPFKNPEGDPINEIKFFTSRPSA